MASKRRHERFVRRLELEFSAGGHAYRAISSDFSCGGLFIRTNRAFAPGSHIGITVYLPDGNAASLSGVVRRAIKMPGMAVKNGMGVEIMQSDDNFRKFIASVDASSTGSFTAEVPPVTAQRPPEPPPRHEPPAGEFVIVACASCGVKNKIRSDKASLGPKCGKCGSALDAAARPKPAARQEPRQSGPSPSAPEGVPGDGIGGLIGGRYRIQNIFGGDGKSAMGIVYICDDIESGTVVALKTLQKRLQSSKKIVDNFKKEALAWIHLGKHPHIVRAFWAREIDRRMFIACEYVSPDGLGRNSLTHYLKEPFSLEQTLTWAIQFCHGMEYACSRGVTPHRDVKPDNIMISMDGDVKITDFGLVGLWSQAEGMDEIRDALNKNQEGLTFLTRHNDRIVAGSPPWMAPEQFYGVAKPSSDIYSLGIVLFQMVNFGELPWKPRKGDSWATAHKTYPLPRVPHRGAALAQIIGKCLEKRRDKRYQDFAELRADLEEVFRREITRRTGEEPPEPPPVEDLGDTELVNKGMTLANLGLLDEGIRHYREGLRKDPGNAPAHYNLGNALAQKGFLREAVMEYRAAIKIDPDMTAARFNLGIALFRQGRTDDAIHEYREVLRLHPESPDVYVNLGVALHKKGLLHEAVKAYREAVRIRPSFAEAHYKLGISLFGSDLLDEAAAAFREAVRSKPDFAEAHNNLGTVFMKRGLYDDAISAYGRAVASSAGYSDAYYNMGLAFLKRDLPREAVRAFEEYIRCADPQNTRAEKARSMVADLRSRLGLN